MAETTPLERAIAAAQDILIGHVDPYSTNLSDYGLASDVARAVLTAIREPSGSMIEQGYASYDANGGSLRDTFMDMIDDALAEDG